jgi:hypothetical protein
MNRVGPVLQMAYQKFPRNIESQRFVWVNWRKSQRTDGGDNTIETDLHPGTSPERAITENL